tara:strand:- start:489 stop:1448 length:960 start_codon:yes stop_codon:yes gene_type:complete
MHSITDIATEMYPELIVCNLDYIKHDQQLVQDAIEIWKKDNCQVLIYSLDNFVNDSVHIENIRSQYEKFAFTTPGVHKEDNHISNVDYLTMFSCGNTQPIIDHEQQKKYDFVYLVGKLHDHRMYLLEALAKKGILEHTLLSLRNPSHAYDHLLPKHSALPEEYEWQDITKIGDFQAGWHSRDSQMAIAFNKNIGIAHPLLYRDTAFSIVSETNIDPNINYITEKTWTPIVAEHLIISHGNKGNNYFLEQLGFIMLNEFVPHYDESDHNKVTDICENLHEQGSTSIYKHTEKQRKHNKNHAMDEEHWKNYHSQQLKSYFK